MSENQTVSPQSIRSVLMEKAGKAWDSLDPKDLIKSHYSKNKFVKQMTERLMQGHSLKNASRIIRGELIRYERIRFEKQALKNKPLPRKQRNLKQINDLPELQGVVEDLLAKLKEGKESFKAFGEKIGGFFTETYQKLMVSMVDSALTAWLASHKIDVVKMVAKAIGWCRDCFMFGYLSATGQHAMAAAMATNLIEHHGLIAFSPILLVGTIQLVKFLLSMGSVEEQGGVDEDVGQGIFTLFYGLFDAIKPTSMSDFMKSVEPYTKLTTAMNGLFTLGDKLQKLLRWAFGAIYKLITGHPYVTESERKMMEELSMLQEQMEKFYNEELYGAAYALVERAHALFKQVGECMASDDFVATHALIANVRIKGARASFTIPPEIIERFNQAKEALENGADYDEVEKGFAAHAADLTKETTKATWLSNRLKDLQELNTSLLQKAGKEMIRQRTAVFALKGEAGVGKDELCTKVVPSFVAAVIGDNDLQRVYNYARGLNFQTYRGEKTTVMSDMFIISTEAAQQADIEEIWKMRETSPQQHDAADISDKGTVFDVTELCLCSTNKFLSNSLPVAEMNAIVRSFEAWFEIRLNPEYGIQKPGVKNLVLNYDVYAKAVAKEDYETLDKIWSFVPYTAMGTQLKDEAVLTLSKFVHLVVERINSYRKTADAARNMRRKLRDNPHGVKAALAVLAKKPSENVPRPALSDEEKAKLREERKQRKKKSVLLQKGVTPTKGMHQRTPDISPARGLVGGEQEEGDRVRIDDDIHMTDLDFYVKVEEQVKIHVDGFTEDEKETLSRYLPDYIYDGTYVSRRILAKAMNLEKTDKETVEKALHARAVENLDELRNADESLTESAYPLPKDIRHELDSELAKQPYLKTGFYLLLDGTWHWSNRVPEGTTDDKWRTAAFHLDALYDRLTPARKFTHFVRSLTPAIIAGGVAFASLLAGITAVVLYYRSEIVETQAKSDYNTNGTFPVSRRRHEVFRDKFVRLQGAEFDAGEFKNTIANLRAYAITHQGKVYTTLGTMIRGRLMETVGHGLLQSDGTAFPKNTPVKVYANGEPFNLCYGDLQIARGKRDYAVVKMPRAYHFGKDISNKLPTRADYEKSMPRHNTYIGRQLMGDNVVLHRVFAGDVEDVDDVQYKTNGGEVKTAHSVLRFAVEMKKGDCGGMYVTGDTHFGQGYRNLLGPHQLGVSGSRVAFGIMRTREDFEECAALLADESPSEEDTPEFVALPNAEEQNGVFAPYNIQGVVPVELRPHVATETEIRPSLIQKALFSHPDIWPEPKTAPVVLKKTKDHDPYLAAFVKIQKTNTPWSDAVKECYTYAHERTRADLGKAILKRPLTPHETINGLPQYGILRIPMNTSLGFRGETFPRELYRDRRDMFTVRSKTSEEILNWAQAPAQGSDEDYYPVQALYEEWVRIEKLMRSNVSPYVIWVDQVKDERKPKEKIYKGRLFSFAPIAFALVTRKYSAMLGTLIGDPSRRVKNGWAYKVNPDSAEWEHLYSYIRYYEKFIIGDMGNFDARTPPQFNVMARDIHSEIFDEFLDVGDRNAVRVCIETHIHAIRLGPKGILYLAWLGAISGHSWTTILNMLNQKFNLHAFDYYSRRFKHAEFSSFHENFGDDFLKAITQYAGPEVNFFTFQDFLAETGQLLTAATKDGREHAFTPAELLEMLKRGFSDHEGHIFAPLKADVLYETPLWILKGNQSDVEATRVNAEMALRGAFAHGREFYESFRKRLVRACLAAGVNPKFPFTYDSLMTDFAAGKYKIEAIEEQSSVVQLVLKPVVCDKIKLPRVATTLRRRTAITLNKSLVLEWSTNRLATLFRNAISEMKITNDSSVKAQAGLMNQTSEGAPQTREGLTTFQSAGVTTDTAPVSGAMALDLNPFPAADTLTNALSRSYLVDTVTWASSDAAFTQIAEDLFPRLLTAFSYISDKMKDYEYFKYDGIEITINYASNPYLIGTLAVIPTPSLLDGTRSEPEVLMNSGAVLISASRQEDIGLSIPSLTWQYMLRLSDVNVTDWEALHFVVLNPLVSLAGGTPSIKLAVYARFINPRLIAPNPRSALTVEEQSSVTDEAVAKSSSGVLTGVQEATGAIGKVIGVVEKVASIGEMALLSKPLSVQETQTVLPVMLPGFGSVKGTDLAQRTSYGFDALVGTKGIVPGQTNSVTLRDIAKIPGWLVRGSFDATASQNTIIASIPVCPAFCPIGPPGPGQPVILTPSALVTNEFDFWRGSMKYAILFDLSPLQTVTVSIAWIPNSASTSGFNVESVGGDIIRKVVNISGPTWVNFEVPWVGEIGWRSCPVDPNEFTDDIANGRLIVSIVESISSPTAITTAFFSIWGAASDDYEVARASGLPTGFAYGDEPGLMVEEQTSIRSVFEKPFPGLIPSRQFQEMGVCTNESIASIPLSVFGKRYRLWRTVNSGPLDQVTEVTMNQQVGTGDPFLNILSAFYYWRGSVNLTFLWQFPSTDIPRWYRKVAAFSTNAYDGNGSLNMCETYHQMPVTTLALPWLSRTIAATTVEDSPAQPDMTFVFECLGTTNRDQVVIYRSVGEDFSVGVFLAPLYCSYTAAELTKRKAAGKTAKRVAKQANHTV